MTKTSLPFLFIWVCLFPYNGFLYAQGGNANCLCTSIQTTVQQITSSPTACCYRLSTQITSAGDLCFQYINVQVDAGLTISPSSTQAGWTVTTNGPQSLTITPPNGFVPQGNTIPITFCVAGDAAHSILVTAGYNDSAGAHECDHFFSFSCPDCNCPPPTELTLSDAGTTGAVIRWVPATCSESTWVYVEDGVNPAEHISRPTPVDSIVLGELVPGAIYQIYAFSMCEGVMSESSDTIRYLVPCPCLDNLISNGGFHDPVIFPTVPNAPDQIGLCPGWQATANGGSASGIGDWYLFGSPNDFPVIFPAPYYDAPNDQYTFLPPYCSPWHAGFDLNTCEGISTQLSSPIPQSHGYTLGFWWALREPVTSPFTFQAILSDAACIMNTTNAGTICTRQCGNDTAIPVHVTTSHQPGVWYFHTFTANTPVTVSHLTFTASASGPTVANYVYIDEVCLRSIWLPCSVDKPRISYHPAQPNAFLGEVELGAGSTLLSAVWDFGDGSRDSSCCAGSVIHDFAPGIYEVCLRVTAIDSSGTTCSNTSCIQVNIVASGNKCDDIAAFLQPSSLGDCCYLLNISNAAANCFTEIDLTLSSGDYVNTLLGANWNFNTNGNTATLTLGSGSGFIPVGNDIPITICNPGGSDPYTVDVDFVYNGGLCQQSFAFSCDSALCTCEGFQNLSFFNFLAIPDISVACSNQISLQLPCIANDALYDFQGSIGCQGNCLPTVHYEIFLQNGPSVLSGSTVGPYFSTGPFKFPPGDYCLNLTGICGGDTCTCFIKFTIQMECADNCYCGIWSNTSYRFGGALNQPISCAESVPIPANAPLAVYTDFMCQGVNCPPGTQIDWIMTGPAGAGVQSGVSYSVGASPAYSIFVPGGTFSLPGTYTLTMQGYCGADTCFCILQFESAGICCTDYQGFCDLVDQGFTVQNDGCNVIVTAPQFGICNAVDATLDWGDGTPLISGTIAPGATWTHSYNATPGQIYQICATVYEGSCWTKQMCTPVTITCLDFCEQNFVQNGNFNQGIPNGFDESINLANHWGSIWPNNLGYSTGDFYNTFAVPFNGLYTAPLPASQGNFGGFWCAIQPGQSLYREGIMNTLSTTLPASGSGQYNLSFKTACMTPVSGATSLSIFGVFTPGLGSGALPLDESSPLNTGLFPPGLAVEIATLSIASTCDENFNTFNFLINPAQFPAQGINHLFFTRKDNLQGETYLAIDDVCLTEVLESCCSSQSEFEQIINQETSIVLDSGACAVTLQTGNITECNMISAIDWGDGNSSAGPFGPDVSVQHTYESVGPYTITFLATQSEPGSGVPCFQKSFSQMVDPVCFSACPCLGFSNMIWSPGQGGGPQSVSCGTDVLLPCQPGVTYTLTGALACLNTGTCPSTGAVHWQLFGPQGLVDAGSTIASPGFSIPFPSGYFYVPGTYALNIDGQCGSPCPCTIYFVVDPPCPALCPCDVEDLQADVFAGFLTSQYFFPSCKMCFKGAALGPCDVVEWSVDNGPFSTPIPASQSFCYPFSGNGMHVIEMRVTRKKGVNLICESFTFQKTVTVNCKAIPITIPGPRVFDPGSHVAPLPLTPDQESAFRVTGIDAPGEKTALRIFPNPNTGTFSAELTEAAAAGMYFRIVGITGQVLQEQSIQTGSKLQTVQVSDLPGGLYFLQVVSEGGVVAVEKFVKQ